MPDRTVHPLDERGTVRDWLIAGAWSEPADDVGGECVFSDDTVTYMEPAEHAVEVRLPSGTTSVVVASWQVAFRECRQVVRLRVEGLPVRVVVPSAGAHDQFLDAIATPTWGDTSGEVTLTGPPGAALRVGWHDRTARLRLDDHGTARLSLTSAAAPDAGNDSMLSTGEMSLRLALDDDRSPVFRELGGGARASSPVGSASSTRTPTWRSTRSH